MLRSLVAGDVTFSRSPFVLLPFVMPLVLPSVLGFCVARLIFGLVVRIAARLAVGLRLIILIAAKLCELILGSCKNIIVIYKRLCRVGKRIVCRTNTLDKSAAVKRNITDRSDRVGYPCSALLIGKHSICLELIELSLSIDKRRTYRIRIGCGLNSRIALGYYKLELCTFYLAVILGSLVLAQLPDCRILCLTQSLQSSKCLFCRSQLLKPAHMCLELVLEVVVCVSCRDYRVRTVESYLADSRDKLINIIYLVGIIGRLPVGKRVTAVYKSVAVRLEACTEQSEQLSGHMLSRLIAAVSPLPLEMPLSHCAAS